VQTDAGEIVELPFYWSQDDAPHFNYNMSPEVSYQSGMSSPETVFDIWRTEFEACYDRNLLFHLVTHPQIIGRPHRMDCLERLFQEIRSRPNVWVARPKEIARYYRDEVDDHQDVRSV
jgi:hypothetical protein